MGTLTEDRVELFSNEVKRLLRNAKLTALQHKRDRHRLTARIISHTDDIIAMGQKLRETENRLHNVSERRNYYRSEMRTAKSQRDMYRADLEDTLTNPPHITRVKQAADYFDKDKLCFVNKSDRLYDKFDSDPTELL